MLSLLSELVCILGVVLTSSIGGVNLTSSLDKYNIEIVRVV